MVALSIGIRKVFWCDRNAGPFFVQTSFVCSFVVRVGFDNRFENDFVVAIALEPNFDGIESAQVVCVFCNAGANDDIAPKLVCLLLHVENVLAEGRAVGFFDAVRRF